MVLRPQVLCLINGEILIGQHEKEQQELQSEQSDGFAADVLVGLSSTQKYLASKYFYDAAGSRLFEQISLQPEYYPTRVETSILREHSPEIASAVVRSQDLLNGNPAAGISMVELGSGSSTKTRILLEQLLNLCPKVHYFPVDISRNMLQEATKKLRVDFPGVNTTGIPLDFGAGLQQVNKLIKESDGAIPETKLVIFLGSSIGNFEPKQSVSFLRMLRQNLSENDYLLVGFDLQKERSVIEAAYNDAESITVQFNLNLLERINKELGGHFVTKRFAHRAFYNEQLCRIEMHLISLTDQEVPIGRLGKSFKFRANETIHTENSYKYSLGQIQRMAEQSGLLVQSQFRDEKRWFVLSLLRPAV